MAERKRPATPTEQFDRGDEPLEPSVAAQFAPWVLADALASLQRQYRRGELSTAQYEALVAQARHTQ